MKGLSERQVHILELKAAGKTSKEIALELDVSHSAIRSHLHKAYQALGVNGAGQAIAKLFNEKQEDNILVSRVYCLSSPQMAVVVDHMKTEGPRWARNLTEEQLRVIVAGVNNSMAKALKEKI
jgi:DNA-binding CsgD family transcriptional regulator